MTNEPMTNDQLNSPANPLGHNKTLLAWHTPEFVKHERGRRWFMTAGVLVLCLVAYAILTDSATMAAVFILLAGVYYLTHNQEPRIIDIQVTELGIFVGETFYAYNMISAYWVVYHPPYVRSLYLKLAGKRPKQIRVELNEQNPVEVRHLLAKEIPEIEGVSESLMDLFIRILRLQ